MIHPQKIQELEPVIPPNGHNKPNWCRILTDKNMATRPKTYANTPYPCLPSPTLSSVVANTKLVTAKVKPRGKIKEGKTDPSRSPIKIKPVPTIRMTYNNDE